MPSLFISYEEESYKIPKQTLKKMQVLYGIFEERHGLDNNIELVFVSDEFMRSLNYRFRNKNCTTDVLSFNLDQPVGLPEDASGNEIYISVEQARRQALELGISPFEEMARLLIHGLLHLVGWDHKTKSTLLHMEQETEFFLQQLKWPSTH